MNIAGEEERRKRPIPSGKLGYKRVRLGPMNQGRDLQSMDIPSVIQLSQLCISNSVVPFHQNPIYHITGGKSAALEFQSLEHTETPLEVIVEEERIILIRRRIVI